MTKEPQQSGEKFKEDLLAVCRLELKEEYEAANKAGYLRALEDIKLYWTNYSGESCFFYCDLIRHINKLKEQQK